MNFSRIRISDIREGLKKKVFSAREITQAYLTQIEKWNPKINAFISVSKSAIQQAETVDEKIAKGGSLRALEGVPVAIKDMFCTQGMRTTAGSKILENFVPPYSATVVRRLEEAGAINLGKCNQDEFAMGSSNENSFFGPCRNPWDLDYVPGGSSGGSAAAVAAGMATAAMGTDTGGSVRQPASFCGVVGIKPTYGRVSRYGIIAFASSLDQAGPFALSVRDAAVMLEAISGRDERDMTTAQVEVPQWSRNMNSNLKGVRIGVPHSGLEEGVDVEVKKAIEKCYKIVQEKGAQLVDISIPHIELAVPIYYLVATAEASSNLARYDGVRYGFRADFSREATDDLEEFYSRTRGEGFGAEVKRRIMLGTYCLSSGYYDAYYKKASQARRLLRQGFLSAFEKCDVILEPVSATPAFKLGEKINDPLKMYKNDIFTTSTNLAGLPGMSVPCGFSSRGLPIGVQLTARHFNEQALFNVGESIEETVQIWKEVPRVLR